MSLFGYQYLKISQNYVVDMTWHFEYGVRYTVRQIFDKLNTNKQTFDNI